MVLCGDMVRTYSQYNKRPKELHFRTNHNATKEQNRYRFAQIAIHHRHDIIEILLKVALNTINQPQYIKGPKELLFRTYHNATTDQKSYGFAHITMQQRTKRATIPQSATEQAHILSTSKQILCSIDKRVKLNI